MLAVQLVIEPGTHVDCQIIINDTVERERIYVPYVFLSTIRYLSFYLSLI